MTYGQRNIATNKYKQSDILIYKSTLLISIIIIEFEYMILNYIIYELVSFESSFDKRNKLT